MRFLSMLLLSGSISLLAAQNQNASPAAVAPKNIPASAVAAQDKLMEGMVVSADKAKQTVVINLRGKDYAFQVTSSSNIIVNNTPGTLDNMVAGTAAKVSYIRGSKGDRVIKSISQSVSAAKMARKPMPASPATVVAPAAQTPVARQVAPSPVAPVTRQAVAPSPVAPAPTTAAAQPAPVAQQAAKAAVAPAAATIRTVAAPTAAAVTSAATATSAAAAKCATTAATVAPTPAPATATPAPSPVAPRPVTEKTMVK
jgi:hypothetical protein